MKRIYLFNCLIAMLLIFSVPAFGDEHKEGEDKKPADVFFFLHSTFQPSRDDFKKPSFANLSTRQVIATCKELERTAA